MYNSGGLAFIRHKDWLGSSRLATTWAHAVYSKEAYAPFGEPYNEAGTPDRSFTGQDQNTTQGIYDYLFRKYDPTAGRWLSPDPAGWSAVDPASPQSLNRYAYVQNDPMRAIDPDGLQPQPCYEPGGDVSYTLCDTVIAYPDVFGISTGTSQPTNSTGGNDGGGGGGGVGPKKPSVLNCASGFAQRTSLAGVLNKLGIGNNGGTGGFLTNALAGNAVSGLVNLFRGQGSMADVAFGGTRGGMPGGATRLNNGISGTLQDTVAAGANAAVNSGAEITTALGGTVSTAALTGAEYATAVGWAKFGYDAASYATGLAGCATGIAH